MYSPTSVSSVSIPTQTWAIASSVHIFVHVLVYQNNNIHMWSPLLNYTCISWQNVVFLCYISKLTFIWSISPIAFSWCNVLKYCSYRDCCSILKGFYHFLPGFGFITCFHGDSRKPVDQCVSYHFLLVLATSRSSLHSGCKNTIFFTIHT